MQKGTDTISLPVIAFDTGEKFEKIRDLIFDQHENRVIGFLVDEGGGSVMPKSFHSRMSRPLDRTA